MMGRGSSLSGTALGADFLLPPRRPGGGPRLLGPLFVSAQPHTIPVSYEKNRLLPLQNRLLPLQSSVMAYTMVHCTVIHHMFHDGCVSVRARK